MAGCSCCGPPPGTRQIEIAGYLVGVVDLDRVLQEVRKLGPTDKEVIKEELLRRVKEKNYVPRAYEDHYREALWKEYRAFAGEAS
jgi:hypothetical protein